ncbi:hypothetical protein GGQ97_000894 [Sphingomonas kaistensis]|uniref:HTH iclR-type domain-containing protein n=1 Tax=Sphingomonas kaistensis TaxID=298708 RepID=A0A7X5Y4T8_9SPHN|nr:hypothetical protein [Sphingomonas kaistensis]NJC05101.1 hypothetical protein [Sphingomonas kaistensis]
MIRIQAQHQAGGESRLAGIQMAILTLRCMEHYREVAGDHDSALVLLAVVAISAEKFTRSELSEELRSLETPFPRDQLGSCNVSSIAVATGFNRETARRYVNRLIERDVLQRGPDGTIQFTPGYLQSGQIADLLQAQLDTLGRSVSEFLRIGAMTIVED